MVEAPTKLVLDMHCDEFLDKINADFGIDVKKAKAKCTANSIATVMDLDDLDSDEL